jgi:hypothetical protein
MNNSECSTKNVQTFYLGTLHVGRNFLHLILSGKKNDVAFYRLETGSKRFIGWTFI